MRRAVPGAMAIAVAMLTVVVAGRPESPATPATELAAELAARTLAAQPDATADAQTYRIGYVSRDRPTLHAAVPGGPAAPVLDGSDAASAAADVDARAGTLVWASPRPAGGSDLFVRRPGGTATQLTTGATDRHPVLSPDGRRVAFTSDRGGNDDIWLVEVTGGAPPVRLTDDPGVDDRPTWSPDGLALAFGSTRDDPAGDLYRLAVGPDGAVGRTVRLTNTPGFDGEPAWSPDGARLAFTTGRFAGAAAGSTTVVSMPAGGGAVGRAVPPPWDAAEPAWAPDGSRLAFVSRLRDPSGDVFVVAGTAVTPVSADPARAERDPAWRGTETLFTTIAVDETTDVWSADERGGDRRDLTARPDLDETGPAFTADGTRLAYSAGQDGGGNRIVVADADGRNPLTIAPPGTLPGDHDTDPTWSPDGTAVAFTRHPAAGPGVDAAPPPSRVLLARVADSALLGELPMPAHLVGQDAEPAWSPEGDRLAVSRSAQLRRSLVDPPRVDQPLLPGRSVDQPKAVSVPEIPATPDIVFFLDTTASMGLIIEALKDTIADIAELVRTQQPDAQFALVAYGAPAGPGNTGLHYRRLVDLTPNDGELADALDDQDAVGGGEEGWYNAIVQALDGGETERVNLRPGGSPIFVLIGDAPSTGNTRFPGTGEVTKAEVIDRMTVPERRAKLVAVPVQGQGEAGLNVDTDANGRGEATEIADATGGTVTGDASPDTVAESVVDGITATRVTVVPQVEGCDDGLSLAFDPPQVTVDSGTTARFTERLTTAAGAVPGSILTCSVLFDVGSPVPEDQVRQSVTVRVAHPPRPFVRVDDVTVTATGPDGAEVTYTASATAPDGTPLPAPDCDPPSGSRFPIGQTLVTCTAGLPGGGEPGRDIALITVLDPNAGSGPRIWIARIATATPDAISFGDQHDLSARVAAQPCQPRVADRAPAWSPDAAELAFSDDGGREAGTGICVVDAEDGGDARTPVLPADRAGVDLADPAWAPDGSRIAFAAYPSEQPALLRTVPSAGGPASTVVRTAGGAAQPAFQVVPARDLSLTVAVSGQPGFVGGADVTLTWTARNTSTRPVRNAFLTLDLPAALLPQNGPDGRCGPAGTPCLLGDLGVGDQQVITVRLPARAAVEAVATGRLTGIGSGGLPVTRFARAPVRVLAPTLTVVPAIGPPGFVTRARGTDFPPGATVRLSWAPGITARPDTVVVNPDGSFVAQVLILRKDVLGPRLLGAERVTGATFGPVTADRPFLVVPRPQAPPNFNGRG
nr:hypothetical protein [Micromonospora sp. DSM 115978]